MSKKIKWERWPDPFDPVIRSHEKTDFTDSYEEKVDIGPCLVGPKGIIPVREGNKPSNLYNFWMGHCNFDLTENLVHQLAMVEGVESFECFSRYRFRMAIGKAFESREVRKRIYRLLNPQKQQKTTKIIDSPIIKHLTNKYTHWAIIELPNGKIETIGDFSEDMVNAKLEKFENVGKVTKSFQ